MEPKSTLSPFEIVLPAEKCPATRPCPPLHEVGTNLTTWLHNIIMVVHAMCHLCFHECSLVGSRCDTHFFHFWHPHVHGSSKVITKLHSNNHCSATVGQSTRMVLVCQTAIVAHELARTTNLLLRPPILASSLSPQLNPPNPTPAHPRPPVPHRKPPGPLHNIPITPPLPPSPTPGPSAPSLRLGC